MLCAEREMEYPAHNLFVHPLLGCRLEEFHWIELAADNGTGFQLESVFQDRRVNLTEVRTGLEVAAFFMLAGSVSYTHLTLPTILLV